MQNQEIRIEIVPPSNPMKWQTEISASKKHYHCVKCQKVFNSSSGLKSHQISNKCSSLICNANHVHELINSKFNSMQEARSWIFDQEMDKILVIVGSREGNIRYQCRQRDVSRNPITSNKIKKRNRKPISRCACPASLNIRKIRLCFCEYPESSPFCENIRTMFQLLGCLAHSHTPQKQFYRIPKVKKDMLLSLMEIGVPKKVILEKYCSPENADETEDKIVTLKDLDNFEKFHAKTRKNSNAQVSSLRKISFQKCLLSAQTSCIPNPLVTLTVDNIFNDDHDYCSTNVIPFPKVMQSVQEEEPKTSEKLMLLPNIEATTNSGKDFQSKKKRVLEELDEYLGQLGPNDGEELLERLSEINEKAKAILVRQSKEVDQKSKEENAHPVPLNSLNEEAVRDLLEYPFVVNEMVEHVEEIGSSQH